eukprot:CAMPEP_0185018228 /NCGR_PEP_ID=MMETSP1103-20130426/1020_1 /TAXON_ID=36769 /ORGANISM="Paraphysomonas bandaiensis, Strain Caron Lab Isolate" /LENGTH=1519 /DNA_ID=CAMNT_0027547967 /DNA_START=70 /DNA_END=4626 /DNA_ORIENTATION=-
MQLFMSLLYLSIISLINIQTYALQIKKSVVGSISYAVNSQSDKEEWIIQPPLQLDRVSFVFRSLNIRTAQLQIYDSGTSLPIFACVACGSLIPPAFTSSTGSVTIQIHGVVGASFSASSFDLQYVGHLAQGQVYNASSTNFLLNYVMGYGHIQPPLIGGKTLPANSKMQWSISVSADVIRFVFAIFQFELGCNATLSIYDGPTESSPVLFRGGCFSASKPEKWIYSTSGRALIVLVTGSVEINANFLIDYIADEDLYHCGSLQSSPDVLLANSMSIVDGSKSSNVMRRGEACNWRILPTGGGPVVLLLRWVSLKPGAKVIVYDSDGPDGVQLWNSEGTFAIVPPPLVSSGKGLYVSYTANTLLATSFLGFRGDYFSGHKDTSGMGDSQELYSMSSAIGITLPDRSPLSPSTVHRYRKNFRYSFLLKPMSAVGPLVIFFSKLSITDCGDILRIYDGEKETSPLLGTFCGTTVPVQWVTATSGVALIQFQSNSDSSRNGSFELSYYSDGPNYHCGFPTNPAELTAPSMRFTDGSYSAETMYSNQHCEWIIKPTNSEGLFLYFDRLDIYGGGTVTVYDGVSSSAPELTHISSATAVPVPVYSRSSTGMRVVYRTPFGAPVGNGFSVAYYAITSIHTGPGDGVINLYSSSYYSLQLPRSVTTRTTVVSNYTWHINPIHDGALYFVFSMVSIVDCSDALYLYSGGLSMSPSSLVASITCTGVEAYNTSDVYALEKWVEVPSGEAVLQFISTKPANQTAILNTDSFIDVSYFSLGDSYHCGLAKNPGKLTAPSMHFSDGSEPAEPMHIGDTCEWVIYSAYATTPGKLVLELTANDLRGGAEMWIYDGSDDTAVLLWYCIDCTELPDRIVSSSSTLFVRFKSPVDLNSQHIGSGFQASYWSITEPFWRDSSDPMLLLSPSSFSFSSDIDTARNTSSWNLRVSTDISALSYYPWYSYSVEADVASNDGRVASMEQPLRPPENKLLTCGTVHGAVPATLVSPKFSIASNQVASSFLTTLDSVRSILSLRGEWEGKSHSADVSNQNLEPVVPGKTCVYSLDSGNTMQSITLRILEFKGETTGRLRVIGGLYGYDHVLLDINRVRARKIKINIPCGRATIIIDANTTKNMIPDDVDFGLEMQYWLNGDDQGQDCLKYIKSLKDEKEDNDFYTKFFIPLAVITVFAIAMFTVLFVYNRLPKCVTLAMSKIEKSMKRKKKKKYEGAAPRPYPKYTPKMDEVKNKLLFRGDCMVCHIAEVKVLSLKCKHKICLDDLRGYVVAALGDVSMFPLKCPLHFENCVGLIDAEVAKRVLTETQYDKFIEFCDRSMYGEGMRCIFCNNFVNYPSSSSVSMVECPYCIQRFCIRCKKPWHYGQRCSAETVDDQLEEWTKIAGAQKCPSCSKIIEKDDPDTCHHMVHKSSDGIPCVRDRTDFCYLCGLEVTPDYPHEEVKNPGINHFPEGVFQRCRTQMVRERALDRERLRKAKRMKKQQTLRSRSNVSAIVPVDDWDIASVHSATSLPTSFGDDPFDVQW